MKVITPGHKYELENHEHPIDVPNQTLQFIEKKPVGDGFPEGSLITVNEGTTNEEVLDMLVDRMKYLQQKFPCTENIGVIANLEEALVLLNRRTSDRKARNVEGKQIA